MFRKGSFLLLIALLLSLGTLALAHGGGEIVAEGLNDPRHLTIADDGTIYIAEAGIGGDQTATDIFGGPVQIGDSSQVVTVSAEGEVSILMPGFLSMTYFGGYIGVQKVIPTDDSLWVLVGLGPVDMPEEFIDSSLIQYNLETMEQVQVIDLAVFEEENNPDADTQTIVSNPADFEVAADGTIYIVDASGNSVLKWTEADGLSIFAAFALTDDGLSAVPTSIDVADDGTVYIGFLGGFPFQRDGGTSRIERYLPDGTLDFTYTGVNLVTDVVYSEADGMLYAVELADGFGDTGYIPETGRVIGVTEDEITVVAEALNFPYGLAIDSDGHWLVSVNSSFTGEGTGQVIAFSPEDLEEGEHEEGETEEGEEEPAEPDATEDAG